MAALDAFRGRSAILFDLDGTLYGREDYADYFVEVDRVTGRRIAELYGVADPLHAFELLLADQRRLGLGSKSETLQARFGIGLAEMNRWREAHTRPEDHLVADARLASTLEVLAQRFTLVLGTNNAPGLARRILACLSLSPSLFAGIHTSEDAGAAKPDPAFFRHVAASLGRPCDAFVSVGDTPSQDLAPAAALGMGTFLVARRSDVYGLVDARA